MNVIIYNQQDNIIDGLNIEVMKSIKGEFKVDEIINTFSNYFFSRMIIDVTALEDYTDINTYRKLSIALPVDKIILLIPSQTEVATNIFLSRLISMGYYNFTTNSGCFHFKNLAHHMIRASPLLAANIDSMSRLSTLVK